MHIHTLRAAEVMTSQVVQVDPSTSLREAMRRMVQEHVGSLPIVDENDRCLGVVTARDILNCELAQADAAGESEFAGGSYYNPDSDSWESVSVCVSVDALPEREVRDVMSDHVVFVHPDASVLEVAEAMVGEGLHHVLVIDRERRLCGVISSLDFVKLALQATG